MEATSWENFESLLLCNHCSYTHYIGSTESYKICPTVNPDIISSCFSVSLSHCSSHTGLSAAPDSYSEPSSSYCLHLGNSSPERSTSAYSHIPNCMLCCYFLRNAFSNLSYCTLLNGISFSALCIFVY